jgi:hypothetical protein
MILSDFTYKYIRPWFFKNDADQIQPIRVAISMCLLLIIAGIIIKFISPQHLSDVFVLGLIGKLTVLLGADTWRQNTKTKINAEMEGK